jgi:hypothetical protein
MYNFVLFYKQIVKIYIKTEGGRNYASSERKKDREEVECKSAGHVFVFH